MAAEHAAGNGGEHANQFDLEGQRKALLRSAGEPIVVMRSDEIICVGISHGLREDELYVRDTTGELNMYRIDEFTFATGDSSVVAEFLDDIIPDLNSASSI